VRRAPRSLNATVRFGGPQRSLRGQGGVLRGGGVGPRRLHLDPPSRLPRARARQSDKRPSSQSSHDLAPYPHSEVEAVQQWKDATMQPEQILKGSFLLGAFASFILSVAIYFQADDMEGRLNGIYVGIWVPSILALGAFVLAHRGTPK
jgi:hypothetical protein